MRLAAAAPVRPLLKWAGGKRQLLPVLRECYPVTFTRYLEPFFGSGAVFFDLLNEHRLHGARVELADVNPDLVGCYRMLRDRTDDVIEGLAALQTEHRQRGEACYYEVRDRRFNPARLRLTVDGVHGARLAERYTPALAAMLIFLNRTGFNGLFRLNRMGAFNVPAGRYKEPRICDPEHLHRVAGALRSTGVSIECRSFEATLAEAGAGDFVYCDPPYAPLSTTSSFAQYTADGFSAFDQRRLQQTVIAACRRGALMALSNSSAPEIVRAYSGSEARRAGLRLTLVPARRAINSRSTARGPVKEVLVTNVPPRAGTPQVSLPPGRLKMAKVATPRRRARTA